MAYEHIQKELVAQKKSQKEMAGFMGIAAVLLTNAFKGRRKIKAKEVPLIAKFLNWPVEKVLNEDYHSGIPLIGNLERSGIVELTVDSQALDDNIRSMDKVPALEFVPCPRDSDFPDMFCVRVNSDEYVPIEIGSLLYCAEIIQGDLTPYLDRRVFIKTADGMHYIRWLRRGSASFLYDLVSERHEVTKDVRVDWCARIKLTKHA